MTKDRRVARYFEKEAGLRLVLLGADRPREQLLELARQFPLAPASGGGGMPRGRSLCSICNVLPEKLDQLALPDSVPEYVRAKATGFRRCPCCRRIYWDATHQERFWAEMAGLGLGPAVEASR